MWTVCLPNSYPLLSAKRWTYWTPLLVVNFNWESLTLAKVENSKVSCKEFCTNTFLNSEVKYWKWEQIVSCQLSAKLLSFYSKPLRKTAYNSLHLCNWLKSFLLVFKLLTMKLPRVLTLPLMHFISPKKFAYLLFPISLWKKVHHYEQKNKFKGGASYESRLLRSYKSDVGTMYFLLSLPDMQLLWLSYTTCKWIYMSHMLFLPFYNSVPRKKGLIISMVYN